MGTIDSTTAGVAGIVLVDVGTELDGWEMTANEQAAV
jgi:hypothetical protein